MVIRWYAEHHLHTSHRLVAFSSRRILIFLSLGTEHRKMNGLTAKGSITRQSSTADTVVEEEQTCPSITKKKMDVVMNCVCSPVSSSSSSSSSDNIQCNPSIATKDNASNNSNSWPIMQDAVPTAIVPSMPVLHAMEVQPAEMLLPESDIRHSMFTYPQHQQKRCSRTEHQGDKFAMKGFGRVQFSSHHECQQGSVSKELVRSTQPGMLHIPVFPSLRTPFFAPSTRDLRHRINNSREGARTSLRSCEPILHFSHQSQEKQCPRSCDNVIPSCHPQSFISPAPHLSYEFDKATLSSPGYLQTLLESPARNCKATSVVNDPKPVKYTEFHCGSTHSSSINQQLLRSRPVDDRSSNRNSLQFSQQQAANEYHGKYLRPVRQGHITNRNQRVTLTFSVPKKRK